MVMRRGRERWGRGRCITCHGISKLAKPRKWAKVPCWTPSESYQLKADTAIEKELGHAVELPPPPGPPIDEKGCFNCGDIGVRASHSLIHTRLVVVYGVCRVGN